MRAESKVISDRMRGTKLGVEKAGFINCWKGLWAERVVSHDEGIRGRWEKILT